MSRLPAGMFLPGTSLLYRLDAKAKFLAWLLLLAAIICTNSIAGYGMMILAVAGLILLSGVPFKTALGSAGRMVWFFIIILLMNTCFYSPQNAWFSIWIFNPSYAGLMQGVNVIFRVFLLLIISNILTVTTAPMELTNAIAKLIAPLRHLGIPTEQVAMILSVAIQFIPTLLEETDMIRKAQTARGARFDSKKLYEKAGAVMPLVVPIFLAAFKRADELATAMEARGYRIRTRCAGRKSSPLHSRDYAALAASAAICAVQIFAL